MQINFFLVATGSVAHPKLDIAIHAEKPDTATQDAAVKVQQLFKAGYFTFTLWDHRDELDHKPTVVCTYRVEQDDPKVTWRV